MEEKYSKYAEDLRKAMKGAGTDEKMLIKVTLENTHKERMKIREAYKSNYGQDLMKDFNGDLSGDLLKLMLALYTDPVEYDAECLYNAIKGAGTDEKVLTEIIASRPGWYLKKVKDKYYQKYNKTLEEDVKGDTSCNYKLLLVSLLQANRSENQNPDKERCIQIAKELYQSGEGKVGTNEEVFNKHFSLCSPAELAVVAREYHKISGKKNLMEAISSEFSGDIKDLLETLLYVLISPSEYFATKILKAIKGLGTDDKSLIRIIVSRNEVDMPQIKKFFQQLYNKDMVKEVKDDVSGDYGKLIVGLIDK